MVEIMVSGGEMLSGYRIRGEKVRPAAGPTRCLYGRSRCFLRNVPLRDLAPRIRVPVLAAFCSEVVWGPKIFPLGPQNRRPVRSSRHVLIERKAKSNAGGLVVLLID